MAGPTLAGAPREAVEMLLRVARRRLGMQASFLAELTDHQQIYQVATGTDVDSFRIHQGGRLPRIEGYCRHVMTSDAPWVIHDTSAEPRVRDLAVTEAGRFGAYIGVPVHLPDGRPFGTLCCVSHEARHDLDDRDVGAMQALADVLTFHVEQLGGQRATIEELSSRVEDQRLRLEVFRHLVDADAAPVLVLAPASLQILHANRAAAELAGTAQDQLVGRSPWEVHPCWSRDELLPRLRVLQDPEGSAVVTYASEPVDGAPAMDVHVQRVATSRGESFLLWAGHDVDAHRRAEAHLRRALAHEQEAAEEYRRVDALRQSFLSAVSHELRTPLTTVVGALETVRAGRVGPDGQAELLHRALVNAGRLDRLLADLLDLNRFTHGALEVARQQVRLDDVVRRAVEEVEVRDRPVELDLVPVTATVAPVKVERIVSNLVRNAVVHTPPGTPVRVHLSSGGDGIHLVVSDRGPGIPPEDRERLLRPFQQGGRVPAHRPGTGIGLSLVDAFARLHDGRAWIDDAEGGGTAVHVRLPLP